MRQLSEPPFFQFMRRVMRMLWAIFILLIMIYIGGFLVYVAEYQRAAEPLFDKADGIVGLTGGPDRISEAVRLLAEKRATRLLISGVNEQTDEDDLIRTVPALQKFMSCCVTIDRDALNTHDNALQSLAWAKQNHFHSLILVTAHAHLPRALFELRALGDESVKVSPWRVGGPTNPDEWWRDVATIRSMVIEYTKLSGSVIRYLFVKLKDDVILARLAMTNSYGACA